MTNREERGLHHTWLFFERLKEKKFWKACKYWKSLMTLKLRHSVHLTYNVFKQSVANLAMKDTVYSCCFELCFVIMPSFAIYSNAGNVFANFFANFRMMLTLRHIPKSYSTACKIRSMSFWWLSVISSIVVRPAKKRKQDYVKLNHVMFITKLYFHALCIHSISLYQSFTALCI